MKIEFLKNTMNKIIRIGRTFVIWLVVFAWVFSGWPQIFQLPPEIEETNAAGLNVGNGKDGSVSFSTPQNINTAILGSLRSGKPDGVLTTVTANPTGTTISVGSINGFAANDQILLINLQGAFGDDTDAGKYEFLDVSSVAGTTITVKKAIQRPYGGTTFSNQKVIVQRVPQWTTVTLSSGASLSANDWAGGTASTSAGGLIVFRANTVTVNSGAAISVNRLGYRGGGSSTTGGGLNGESYDGVGSAGVSAGGDDTTSGSGGGNIGTRCGGGSSGSGLTTSGNTVANRGGGGGGGNTDANITTDSAGGGAGGGYGFGGGGGGGGGDGSAGGAGGIAGSTSVNGGGGGGGIDDTAPAGGGGGGNAGSAGADAGSAAGGDGGAVGSGTSCGLGGSGGGSANLTSGAGGGGGGGSYGTADLTTIFFGSGGGGGGGHDATTATAGATGGAGGGIIYIIADTINLPGTGTITANGANGVAGSIARVGNSGGGAGGSIYLRASTLTLGTNLVNATGGSRVAAAASPSGGGGGAGGNGRINSVKEPSSAFKNWAYNGIIRIGKSGKGILRIKIR